MQRILLHYPINPHLYLPLIREFNSIRKNVHEYLPQHPIVLNYILGHVLGHRYGETQSFILCHRTEDTLHLFEQVGKLELAVD